MQEYKEKLDLKIIFADFRTDFVLFGTILWQRKTKIAIVKSTRKLSKKFTGR